MKIHFAEVADAIRKFREEVRVAILETGATASEICGIDETAMQFFARMVKTLHWKGQSNVPGAKTDSSRLYFSVPVICWADGRIDFIVVYSSKAKNKPRWEKLGDGEGVFWLRAETKWTTMETYPEMLRGLIAFHACKVQLDDNAGGHGGPGPDCFLFGMGARRVRVPRRATSLVQPGDRPKINQEFREF